MRKSDHEAGGVRWIEWTIPTATRSASLPRGVLHDLAVTTHEPGEES